MSDSDRPGRGGHRLLVGAAVAGALLALYAAAGFLAAPAILRSVIVKQGSATLHREVSVAKVRVNPFALSVTIEGLEIRHRDGAPFAGWASLYVRLAPLRLLAGDIGFAQIRLVRPSVHVGLRADGTLSFQDLLASEEAPGKAAPAPADEKEGRALSIGRLAIEEAKVAFRDETRRPAFETALGPLTIRLDSFRTKGGRDSPYSFSGTTDAGESFRWTGTVRTQPFRSAGTLAFERIALPKYGAYVGDDLLPADLHGGLVDFETGYDVEWGTSRRLVKTAGGKLVVTGLALGPRRAGPAVKLARIEVGGIEADPLARSAKVAEVAIRGGTVHARKGADGAVDLVRMTPPPSPAPWTWSVGALSVSGLAVTFEDLSTPRPAVLPLTDVAVRLERLASDPASTSPLSASLVWNGRGKVSVSGPVKPFGNAGTLDVDVKDLDLAPLQPYLERDLAARLVDGRLGVKAKVALDASGKEPRWKLAGDVRVDSLAVTEPGNEDLLRWRALEITGVQAGSTPQRANVKLVRLVEPRSRIYVWEDGRTSIDRVLKKPPASAAAPPAAAPASSRPPAAPAWRTAVGAVQVVRGRLAFVDRSVTPAALLNVTGAEAKVKNLSSDPRVRSDVDVRLQIEGASPIQVSGTVNPLQTDAFTDLTITSKGVDLSPAGPYSGKFLGYGIRKGKLDLDLRYKIEKRMLEAANVVKVNQFTLGDATNSPDATKIPVRLALALLKDKDGVILLDVPIEGKLDDPEFHLGKVIWHTVLNLLVKVAASPFKALAALAGGGEADLSTVEFAPGTADPLPQGQDGLSKLARSLAQRPELGLELEGSADEGQDGPALRRAALERSLRHARAARMRPPPASADEVTVSPEERARLVREMYDAAFPAGDRKRGEPAPTQQQMEDRLAAAAQVPPDRYRALAAERAQRAREALIAAGLDQSRLFLTSQGGGRAEKEKGARVYFAVR